MRAARLALLVVACPGRAANSADGGGQFGLGTGSRPDGQGQRDPQAARAYRRGLRGAAVRGGDLRGDGQPEARAGAARPRPGAVEALEDVRQLIWRNTGPIVADLD